MIELEFLDWLRQRLPKSDSSSTDDYQLQDDAARIHLAGDAIVTSDLLCEGVHFELKQMSAHQIGRKALAVNLSDLASSGARPYALLWSLSIPLDLASSSLRELARGFGEVAGQYQCPVIGGNVCARDGGLELHVTAIGLPFSQPITRSGARPGDLIYVTGDLGSRALGYLDPTPETRALRHRWRPHIREAEALARWGRVSAMLDISDGLLLDAERLAKTSGVHIDLQSHALPRCHQVRQHPLGARAALSGGEDYILLFAAPAGEPPPPEVNATLIGRCLESASAEHHLLTLDGEPRASDGHLYHLKR